MFQLLHTFYTLHIQGIFVFDGKPPDSKMSIIKERQQKKYAAQQEFDQLVGEGADPEELVNLRKDSAHLSCAKIAWVKELIRSYGMCIIEADAEADNVCAALIKENIAWAVLSDDSDMFLHGCKRILRNLRLNMNCLELSTLELCATDDIHKSLHMTPESFLTACLLTKIPKQFPITLTMAVQWHNRFLSDTKINPTSSSTPFLEWTHINDHIQLDEKHYVDELVHQEYSSCPTKETKDKWENYYFGGIEMTLSIQKIEELLENYGFVMPFGINIAPTLPLIIDGSSRSSNISPPLLWRGFSYKQLEHHVWS
jgi:hypothetical protein